MSTNRGRHGQPHDPVDNLPEGTAHVVVLREYSGPEPDEEVIEDDLVGPSEIVEFPRVRREGPGKKGEYKPGDEMPLELGGQIWNTPQSEVLACFDEAGNRLDGISESEVAFRKDALQAIDKWGRRRFDDWTPSTERDDASV